MKKIIVIPTYFKQVKFFLRMSESLYKLGYKLDFYVYKLSLYILLKKHQECVHFIKKSNTRYQKINEDIFNKSIEYRMGQLSKISVRDMYLSTFECLEKNSDIKSIKCIFIWNGSSIDTIAAGDFAKKYNIRTLYFEIANIPGKIFVDKKGTNATSELYSNIDILRSLKTDEEYYKIWKNNYLTSKLKNHIVPQKRTNKQCIQFRYLLDIIGYMFMGIFKMKNSFLFNKINQIKNNIQYPLKFDKYDYEKKKYIFFPLQVSYDAQILLNSDIGILEALKKAIDYAKQNNLDLVIKPHPQECNYSALKKILKYRSDFILLNENTFLLMKYAELIWTINSTVGLEAMIMERPVYVLGRSIYRNFKKGDLSVYINSYLIDIDFFSNNKIGVDNIKYLLERL